MSELTLSASRFTRLEPDLKAEVEAWLRKHRLWDERKVTHVHFYEGRVQARCRVGRNPNWSGSAHDDPFFYQLETVSTDEPPPARLVRLLHAELHDDGGERDE